MLDALEHSVVPETGICAYLEKNTIGSYDVRARTHVSEGKYVP